MMNDEAERQVLFQHNLYYLAQVYEHERMLG